MKNLIFAILFLLFSSLSFLGEDTYALFEKALYAGREAHSSNKPSLIFRAKHTNGFLNKNSEIEIKCGNEIVKIMAVNGFFVSRKIIFREEEINLYRLDLSIFHNIGQFGIQDSSKNILSDKKVKLHINYNEYFQSYKSIPLFEDYMSLYNEYCLTTGRAFLSYYDEKGMACNAKIVEDKEHNVIHISIHISQILIDWKKSNKLPPSPFKPNFKIIEPF